jgi:hypothetical protein
MHSCQRSAKDYTHARSTEARMVEWLIHYLPFSWKRPPDTETKPEFHRAAKSVLEAEVTQNWRTSIRQNAKDMLAMARSVVPQKDRRTILEL